jgi:hypothetical protein
MSRRKLIAGINKTTAASISAIAKFISCIFTTLLVFVPNPIINIVKPLRITPSTATSM